MTNTQQTTENQIKRLSDFAETIASVANVAKKAEARARRIEALQQKIEALTAEAKELRNIKKRYDLLLLHSSVKICDACCGDGGYVIGDEYSGFDAVDCSYCDGTGVTNKD